MAAWLGGGDREQGSQGIQLVEAGRYLRDHGIEKADILKMNCEGCEYELFKDERLLDLLHPARIAMEYHRGGETIHEMLLRHGYVVDWNRRTFPKGNIFAQRVA